MEEQKMGRTSAAIMPPESASAVNGIFDSDKVYCLKSSLLDPDMVYVLNPNTRLVSPNQKKDRVPRIGQFDYLGELPVIIEECGKDDLDRILRGEYSAHLWGKYSLYLKGAVFRSKSGAKFFPVPLENPLGENIVNVEFPFFERKKFKGNFYGMPVYTTNNGNEIIYFENRNIYIP